VGRLIDVGGERGEARRGGGEVERREKLAGRGGGKGIKMGVEGKKDKRAGRREGRRMENENKKGKRDRNRCRA